MSTTTLPDPQALAALSPLAREVIDVLAHTCGDIALILDAGGLILRAIEGDVPLSEVCGPWEGRVWIDTVTGESRHKVEELLQEVRQQGQSRRREINHPSQAPGPDVPLAWTAIRLGEAGPVLAVGRDLRAVSVLQRRFMDEQHALETAYWERRAADDARASRSAPGAGSAAPDTPRGRSPREGLGDLVARVGRVPLRELLVEAAGVAERQFVEAALLRCDGRLTAAAELLGIGPQALRSRLQRLGVQVPPSAEPPPTRYN